MRKPGKLLAFFLDKGTSERKRTMTQIKVPLLDLKKQYRQIRREVQREIRKVLESQALILGPEVKRFEEETAAFCRVPHAVGGAGDRVVTSPYTFFATGGCISRLGAIPVFADIEPRTYNLDPNRLEDVLKKINGKSKRPKVLIPVHLYGQMADMSALMPIAKRYGMLVIEDAAQAIGARETSSRTDRAGKEWVAGAVGDLG
ncbi:MAG: Aminotransferase, DegT/DnrJ/EryC1/StrS family, partial [Deltaproteobacteria bacterium]|nr:Aminotransferase, DegT/DnrJ/EryC1/StrS family [Deltaproteobacteria bacterium]